MWADSSSWNLNVISSLFLKGWDCLRNIMSNFDNRVLLIGKKMCLQRWNIYLPNWWPVVGFCPLPPAPCDRSQWNHCNQFPSHLDHRSADYNQSGRSVSIVSSVLPDHLHLVCCWPSQQSYWCPSLQKNIKSHSIISFLTTTKSGLHQNCKFNII